MTHYLSDSYNVAPVSFPGPRYPLPVPLEKGNAGSGNEIGVALFPTMRNKQKTDCERANGKNTHSTGLCNQPELTIEQMAFKFDC